MGSALGEYSEIGALGWFPVCELMLTWFATLILNLFLHE
jgi:hypothetical protein